MHDIRTSFENACAVAQITGKVTPHITRHTFAFRLAMKGVHSLTLLQLGRWTQPKMLEQYAHLSGEHLTEALEKIQPQKNFTTVFTAVEKRRFRKVS